VCDGIHGEGRIHGTERGPCSKVEIEGFAVNVFRVEIFWRGDFDQWRRIIKVEFGCLLYGLLLLLFFDIEVVVTFTVLRRRRK
jgi:hypothetical protein